MSERAIRIPGPDHPITIAPTGRRVVVRLGGTVIADSVDALTVQEAAYPPVQYIPRFNRILPWSPETSRRRSPRIQT